MNKFEEEIEKRYGSFELSHDKNKLITDDIKNFTADVAVKFSEFCQCLDNGTTFYNPFTKEEKESIGFSPFDCLSDNLKTTKELFQIFINNHYGK